MAARPCPALALRCPLPGAARLTGLLRLARLAGLAALLGVGGLAAWVSAPTLANAAASPIRQAPPAIKPFTGTLQTIHETGVIRIGHRQNSPPFAFWGLNRTPIGYSLDLCEVVVEEISRHLHRPIEVRMVPVTPSDRFDLLRAGEIDLECGSSTANDERRKVVAFSPTIFVTGTRLLVRRGSGIRSLRDLDGRTVVLSQGTVHAVLVPQIAARQKLNITFLFARDHDESFAAVQAGKADAFANDDIQLHGIVAARDAAADFRIVGDPLTYADYALAFRRDDPALAAVIDDAFERLAGSGEIRAIYRRWFQRPLPSGVNLNLPMSPHLEHVFRLDDPNAD